MLSTREVLQGFGRIADVARLVGVRHTTVHYWISRNLIPPGRVLQLEELAREHGLTVDLEALRALAWRPDGKRAA